jgi:outer membrane murein-binding lipoprotein Lpp
MIAADHKEATMHGIARMRQIAPIAISITLVLASCSSDGGDESSFCNDREDLQSSMQELRDVNVVDDGIDDLDTALDAVLTDVDTLKASAATLAPQVDALESSLQGLQTAVDSATTPAEKATAAVDGLSNVSTSWNALEDAAGAECD